jgi:ribosomal protein S7
MGNVKPLVEVKSPVALVVPTTRFRLRFARVVAMALAMRWLRESARKRSEKSMGQRLAAEMLEAQRTAVVPSRSVMKFTAWLKPTRRSRTSASNLLSKIRGLLTRRSFFK